MLVDTTGILSGKTPVAIAAGTYHSLALCDDGTLAAWGQNSSGQIGDGTLQQRNAPVDVTHTGILSGNPVIAIPGSLSNAFHSMALIAAPLPEVGGSISGTVTAAGQGGPLAGVLVSAHRDNGTGLTEVVNDTTAADGTYTLSGLPSADYKVFFSTGDFNDQWYNASQNNPLGVDVTVSAPDETTGINAALELETIPVFGQVQVLPQANRYRSTIYGELEFANDGADRTQAISHSLGTSLRVQNGTIHSPLYGNLMPNPWNVDEWVVSQFFGLVHFAQDATQYGGWVNSERFDWMKFEKSGDNSFLWVHHLQTWLAVNADGSFHSFDFGWMTPVAGSLTRYNTRIGMVTADPANPRGWLASDRFGFVWFARDGSAVWFWSDNRSEWVGITAGGSLWSTKEGRFLD